MTSPQRPKTPEYLRQATFHVFGHTCLRCGAHRPVEVAHIHDWPTCWRLAGEPVRGKEPPAGWHYRCAIEFFHALGNVLPLCSNCHDLYDGKQYTDVTEAEIRNLRDGALLRPGSADRLTDFIVAELTGRPGRCVHRDENERRQHSHTSDMLLCLWPLQRLSQLWKSGHGSGADFIVPAFGRRYHVHVSVERASFRMCPGSLERCAEKAPVRSRTPSAKPASPQPVP